MSDNEGDDDPHEDADDLLEGDGDPLGAAAEPLEDTENRSNELNKIKCNNQNTTDSVPMTAIPGEDSVQGKFVYDICISTFLHKQLACINVTQILTRSIHIKYAL
jgi:hypothetical protein